MSWDLPKDSRESASEKNNGLRSTITTPSGHSIDMIDEKNKESVTIHHRSGSLLQFQPDGSIVFLKQKGGYSVTFGDDKVLISGSQDITIQGGGSLRVEGDYETTINGNMKTTVKGNMETLVSGNQNTAIKGNQESSVGGNMTNKILGNMELSADGKGYVVSSGGLGLGSDGKIQVTSGGETSINGSQIKLNS